MAVIGGDYLCTVMLTGFRARRGMIDRREALTAALFAGLGGVAAMAGAAPTAEASTPRRALALMDMVHANPGAAPPHTAYLDPAFLRQRGYGAVVIEGGIEGVATFGDYDPGLITQDSEEGRFAAKLKAAIGARIAAAKRAGLKVDAWVQYVVLPKRLLAKHGAKLVDPAGRIDVRLPATQAVLRAFTLEILHAFPDLDGLVVRTGEIYLQDLPYHAAQVASATAPQAESQIQAGTAISHGEESHRALLTLLREVVCVAAAKEVIYRTWDFGDNFHNNPRYYLGVADQIAPHPKLSFSIKHQRGDFLRLTPFNPTLGLGRHRQVVEAQCQMEAYGKGAHPYYVAQGVIEGWEEFSWLMPQGAARGLRDLTSSPLFGGLWTWSRGGGWDGPYIQDELWCDLNAYVLGGFAQDTSRDEASLFAQYGREVLKLSDGDAAILREISLTSAAAVLRGQASDLGAAIYPWWARDDTLSEPDLGDFVDKGLVEAAIDEKRQAVTMWGEIVANMDQIAFASPPRQAFARVSARYGLYKYSVIAAGWTACLLAADGARNGAYQSERIRKAVARYDQVWSAWRRLAADTPLCPTLPTANARGGGPGLGAAMDRLRTRFGT
jgi:hypothetical protein